MLGLGMQELLIILIILVLIFGSTRLPELGKGIGKAIRNFKKGLSEQDEIDVTPNKPEVTDKDKEEKKD